MNRETEGAQRRYSELEEALEVKSLRRIISAYINYSDSAVEDVRRDESSFRKLSRDHKGLLSHLPLKFRRLRRCINVNSFFIMSMLEAFDPPFDMSQVIDLDGHGDIERLPNGHLCTQASHCTKDCNAYLKQPMPKSIDSASRPDLSSCSGGCDQTPSKRNNEKQEISCKSSCSLMNMNTSDRNDELIDESRDDVKFFCNLDSCPHDSTPNGNISSVPNDWMETSLRLSVSLLDVDQVWINLGPLLYHFADSYGPEEKMSIEISLEDVKKVALQCGFEFEMEKIIETTYSANPRSMMQNHYYTAFWTMKKKPRT